MQIAAKYLSIVLWLGLIVWKGVLPGWQEGRSDFSNYFAASKLLLQGEAIESFYDNQWFDSKSKEIGVIEGAKYSPFTPFTAYLMLPLTGLSEINAKRIWIALNFMLLFLTGYLLHKVSNLKIEEVLMLACLFTIPVLTNLRFGQIYLAITVLLVAGLNMMNKSLKGMFGSIAGIMALIKIFPGFFLLFNLNHKHWKPALKWFFVTVLVLSILLFIHQGLAPFTSYLHVLLGHLSGNLRGQEIHSFTYQSLDSLLSFLFVADPIYNPMPAVDAWYLKTIFKWISIVLIGWMVWRLIERQTKSKWEIRISIALVGLAILFPASATYHFILFLIPFSFIVQRTRLLSKNERIIFYALSLMTFNLIPGWIPALEGSQTLNVLVHYPRLFGLLALFVWMYFRTMKQLNTNG